MPIHAPSDCVSTCHEPSSPSRRTSTKPQSVAVSGSTEESIRAFGSPTSSNEWLPPRFAIYDLIEQNLFRAGSGGRPARSRCTLRSRTGNPADGSTSAGEGRHARGWAHLFVA